MSTNTKTTPARRAYDNALSAFHAATEALAAVQGSPPPAGATEADRTGRRIEELEARAALATCEAAVAEASAPLAAELLALEVASGDEHAKSCAPGPLAADIEATLAEADRLDAAAVEARRQAGARLASARSAHDRLTAARRAAGLPLPAPLPSSPPRTLGAPPDQTPAGVCRAIRAGVVVDHDAERARALRDDARRLTREAEDLRVQRAETRQLTEERLAAKRDAEAHQRDRWAGEAAHNRQATEKHRVEHAAAAAHRRALLEADRASA